MEKRTINVLNDHYYYEKLPNGLQVYMFPGKDKSIWGINFLTLFGAKVNDFKKDSEDEYHHVPLGTAHFLEHQLFQLDNGSSIEDKFKSLGVSANASTSQERTRYTVDGNRNFKASLVTLLDYVQNPHFSDQGTSKEKGIIIEEERMVKNKTSYVAYIESNKALFHNYYYKYPVIGYESEILSIKTEDLKLCYDYFYHPSQMYLIIYGNFNYHEAIEIVRNNQASKTFPKPFNLTIKKITEPQEVVMPLVIKEHDVSSPLITINYKIPFIIFKDANISLLEALFIINYILKNNFGSTSELGQYIFDSNLTDGGLYHDVDYYGDYIVITFTYRSNFSEKIETMITEKLEKLEYDEKTFSRFKKVSLSRFITDSEFKANYESLLIGYLINNEDFPDDRYNTILNYSFENIKLLIDNLDLSNKSIVKLMPMKKQ